MLLLSSLLTMLCAIAGCVPSPTFQSVRPLQRVNAESGDLDNHCTAWAVKKHGKVFWITASHCVMKDDNSGEIDLSHDYQIGGQSAKLKAVNHSFGLAAFTGPDAPGLRIRKGDRLAFFGEYVATIGYPFGWKDYFFMQGVVSNPAYDYADNDKSTIDLYTVYNLTVAPGQSGSPVFNINGEVVGVIQVSFCGGQLWSGFCPESGGSTIAKVQGFIGTL